MWTSEEDGNPSEDATQPVYLISARILLALGCSMQHDEGCTGALRNCNSKSRVQSSFEGIWQDSLGSSLGILLKLAAVLPINLAD